MRLHAVSRLMWQPLPLVMLFVVGPMAVIGLFAKMPSPSGVIGVAALAGGGIGIIFGGFLASATTRTFAPTLPGFAGNLRFGAAVAGLATAVLVGLLCVLGSCAHLAFPAGGVSLALFSLGCTAASPTWPRLASAVLFFASPFVLNHGPWRTLAYGGWLTAVGGTAVAAVALHATFPRRLWFREPTGARRRAVFPRRSHDPVQLGRRRSTTAVPHVFRDLWAVHPPFRFRPLAPRILQTAVIVFAFRLWPAELGDSWWMAIGVTAAGVGPWVPNRMRAGLPWSRRRHLSVAYLEQVIRTLWFVGCVAPLLIAARYAGTSAHAVRGDLVRGIVVCAAWLPVITLLHGPAPTTPRFTGTLAPMGFGALLVAMIFTADAANAASRHVPGFLQALILAAIFVWVQGWYWRHLRHHFAHHDLDGNQGEGW